MSKDDTKSKIDLTSLIPVYEMVFEPDLPKQQSYAVGPLTVTVTGTGDITIDAVPGMAINEAFGAGSPMAAVTKRLLTARPKTWAMSGIIQMDVKDSQALADALSALPQQCGQCGHDRADHWADEDGYSGCGNDCACKEYEQC